VSRVNQLAAGIAVPRIYAPAAAGRTAVPARLRKRDPREIVRALICAMYWLLIFEGCLRKWVLPEFQRLLFFIRDPILLLIYWLAWKNGLWVKRSPFLTLGLLFAVMVWPLVLLQYAANMTQFYWILVIYGWRNYFLYLPLAFIAGACFSLADVEAVMRKTLWLTIPIAILVYIQFVSPGSSAVNQGFGEEGHWFSGLAFVDGKTRPLGTFTSNQGQNPFIVVTVTMLFIAWMTPSLRRKMSVPGLVIASLGPLSCLALSGSRTAVMWSGLIVAGAIAAGLLVSRRRSWAMIAVPLIVTMLGLILWPVAFPDAAAAFSKRWSQGETSETENFGQGGPFARAFSDLFNFRYLLNESHLQGYQLGIGANAAYQMGAQSAVLKIRTLEQAVALESEWGRHIVDLGVLGVAFILFRIAFVLWLGRQAARAALRTGNVHAFLLFCFAGMLLFNGQITGQGAQNGFVWQFVGFTIAACKSGTGAKYVGA
jgi:hypothetical protein